MFEGELLEIYTFHSIIYFTFKPQFLNCQSCTGLFYQVGGAGASGLTVLLPKKASASVTSAKLVKNTFGPFAHQPQLLWFHHSMSSYVPPSTFIHTLPYLLVFNFTSKLVNFPVSLKFQSLRSDYYKLLVGKVT